MGLGLRPVDKRIFDKAWNIAQNEGRPFSYEDFMDVPHGSFRNAVSRLREKRSIETDFVSYYAFYKIVGTDVKLPSSVTPTHMGGGGRLALTNMLLSLKEAVGGIHDIRLLFSCPELYGGLRLIPDKGSGDKRLSPLELSPRRQAKVVVHVTGSISVIIGCSVAPFPRANLGELFLALEKVRDHLQFETVGVTIRTPPIGGWIVNAWQYNKDGHEIAGKRFEVTFSDLNDVFYRLYSKQTSGLRFRPRLERLESPDKSLGELARKVLDEGNPDVGS